MSADEDAMVAAFDYTGKHVVLTGCTSGIGQATARLLARLGAHVHGMDRHGDGEGLAAFTTVDLADPDAIDRAADTVVGPVHGLFNCAGLAPTQPPLAILKVNFLGTRHLTERLVPQMGEGAAIVSVSSNGGLRWRARLGEVTGLIDTAGFAAGLRWLEPRLSGIANAYSFAKEAITVWTLRESARLIARGIRINCTSPGAVQTPMLDEIETVIPADRIDLTTQPIGRRSAPEEQAWPLAMLGSAAASYINGNDLSVDGGFAAALALRDAGA
jgi:NAD(P)-dependent dehydrogenase (short-subunit alcohol dehydrogenase family)